MTESKILNAYERHLAIAEAEAIVKLQHEAKERQAPQSQEEASE